MHEDRHGQVVRGTLGFDVDQTIGVVVDVEVGAENQGCVGDHPENRGMFELRESPEEDKTEE